MLLHSLTRANHICCPDESIISANIWRNKHGIQGKSCANRGINKVLKKGLVTGKGRIAEATAGQVEIDKYENTRQLVNAGKADRE